LVVDALMPGPRRFNDVASDVPGIAPNVLSHRLRQLEADGLVVAQPYSRRPVRFTYELTDRGAALAGAVRTLAHWGTLSASASVGAASSEAEGGGGVVHQACGTFAEPRWWCPTCDRTVEDDDLDEVRWV
jgi:DNA-binding HxlR family transcriptional regulator